MTEAVKRDAAGFRLRGLDTTRIETFTDATFAFALTLLVIALDPIRTFDNLIEAVRAIPAFVLSATLLMMFWWGHHEWSRRYGLDDRRSFLLSCLLVFTVLVYVYPLRYMFGLTIAWFGWMFGVNLGPLAGMADPFDVNKMIALYGVGFTAMATAIMLLNIHAWNNRDELELDEIERYETRGTITVWFILACTGVFSTLLGLFLPESKYLIGMPGVGVCATADHYADLWTSPQPWSSGGPFRGVGAEPGTALRLESSAGSLRVA